jgi:hypothetical protein
MDCGLLARAYALPSAHTGLVAVASTVGCHKVCVACVMMSDVYRTAGCLSSARYATRCGTFGAGTNRVMRNCGGAAIRCATSRACVARGSCFPCT